jgi:hypothetical protein
MTTPAGVEGTVLDFHGSSFDWATEFWRALASERRLKAGVQVADKTGTHTTSTHVKPPDLSSKDGSGELETIFMCGY